MNAELARQKDSGKEVWNVITFRFWKIVLRFKILFLILNLLNNQTNQMYTVRA
jgi:hypothetical protein